VVMRSNLTKSEEITARLRELINKAVKSENLKLPTEKALCEMWGISRGTLRSATDEFVEKGILRKIAGAGTFINSELTTGVFVKKNIKTIVLIYDILQITDFRYRVIKGVVKAANIKGYDTALASFDNALELFREKLFSDEAKYTALASCNFKFSDITKIKEFPTKIPYVALNDYNYKGVADYAVLCAPIWKNGLNYLATLGHKKILLIQDFLTRQNIEAVNSAVKTARDNGFMIEVIIKECQYKYDRVVAELNGIYGKKSDSNPTAVLCVDDTTAAEAILHLRNLDINVPGDVSVAGMGDLDVCETTYPRISTVSIDYDFMGETAVDMIDKQIEGKEIKNKLVIVSNDRIIERDSCKRI
jgi:DNA-binding LacI/PurR family transcriptional regulator